MSEPETTSREEYRISSEIKQANLELLELKYERLANLAVLLLDSDYSVSLCAAEDMREQLRGASHG